MQWQKMLQEAWQGFKKPRWQEIGTNLEDIGYKTVLQGIIVHQFQR
jgi:hypothetical protein